jgi:hypothetical protein
VAASVAAAVASAAGWLAPPPPQAVSIIAAISKTLNTAANRLVIAESPIFEQGLNKLDQDYVNLALAGGAPRRELTTTEHEN